MTHGGGGTGASPGDFGSTGMGHTAHRGLPGEYARWMRDAELEREARAASKKRRWRFWDRRHRTQ